MKEKIYKLVSSGNLDDLEIAKELVIGNIAEYTKWEVYGLMAMINYYHTDASWLRRVRIAGIKTGKNLKIKSFL